MLLLIGLLIELSLLPTSGTANHVRGILSIDTKSVSCSGFNVGQDKSGRVLAVTAAHCLRQTRALDPVLGTESLGGYEEIVVISTETMRPLGEAAVVAKFGDLGIIAYSPTEGPIWILSVVPMPVVHPGDWLLACGIIYPADDGLYQSVCPSGTWTGETYTYDGKTFYIATIPVRAGMSGGPAFNRKGQVVGIYSLQITGGLAGFTPIDPVLPFISE